MKNHELEAIVRILVAVLVFALVGVVFAQRPMLKAGPGGASVVQVVCDDALRYVEAAKKAELVGRFRSDIVIRCVAEAVSGNGRVQPSDFTFRHRYASDERVHTLRMSDFTPEYFGEIYGTVRREFFVGLPARERPWVVILYFGEGSTQIVFTSNR